MKAIAGLGNPGKKYSETRHNFGFMVIDVFANRKSAVFKPGKGEYVYSKVSPELILIKPTTYMNNSGYAVKSAVGYFKIHLNDLTVVYDDIYLPLGTIRFKEKGSAAGHRGVENVIYHLSSHVFPRVKIGIANNGQKRPSEKFVLRKFRKEEQGAVKEVINFSCDALEFSMNHSIQETMNMYNGQSVITGKE